MKAKHTPGPWAALASEMHVQTTDGNGVADSAYEYSSITNEDEHLANLHLIAAAPELLEALEEVLPVLESLQEHHLSQCAAFTRAILQKRINAIKATITKAKGGAL